MTSKLLCARLDPVVHGWNERDLSGQEYPFLLVDAIVISVRKDGRVRLQSVMIATGINRDGYREVLGLKVGDSESEGSWSEFFEWLKGRDLRGVDLVVSDDHKGLVKAITTHFQGATWQRCQTHFVSEHPGRLPQVIAAGTTRATEAGLRRAGHGDRPAGHERHREGVWASGAEGCGAAGGGV